MQNIKKNLVREYCTLTPLLGPPPYFSLLNQASKNWKAHLLFSQYYFLKEATEVVRKMFAMKTWKRAPYQLCMKMWSSLRKFLKLWLFQLLYYPPWDCTTIASLRGSRIFLNDHPDSSWSDSYPIGGRMGWRGSRGIGALLHLVAVDMSIYMRTDVTFVCDIFMAILMNVNDCIFFKSWQFFCICNFLNRWLLLLYSCYTTSFWSKNVKSSGVKRSKVRKSHI